MHGVWYAAVAVAFVLGVLFILAYSRRGTSARAAAGNDVAQASAAQSAAVRHAAQAEADALRRAAESDADALRRAAESEAEATRRAARLDAESEAGSTLATARQQAAAIVAEARRAGAEEVRTLTEAARREQDTHAAQSARLAETVARLDAREVRIGERAAELDSTVAELRSLRADLDARVRDLEIRGQDIDDRHAALDAEVHAHRRELERVANLTAEQAKAELLASVEAASRREAAVLMRSIENEARAEGTERARGIVADAVQRVASAQTTETVVSVLHLPAEEMKGRIIGREGRNIRSFEAITGVTVLIDDTPEAVLLSCFDPVRREVGRLTLEKLVVDGRIHPHRIEEAYEQSVAEVDALCLRAARDAVADVGIGGLDDRLMPILGRLKYRTSYGQNVLAHLTETAHIAGVMAAELGVEPTLVKRSAFLHDIGKALTHEVEGSHAIVGAQLLRKYGEDEAVVHAVEAHHNEVQPRTVEAVLTQASDTCSAARPGARRESVEAYVKRLARIEEIAGTHDGVEKVFAMQAGREVRVMVQPAQVDDLAASVLAREIAKQIEDELTYPGQIRVTVVRESRAST